MSEDPDAVELADHLDAINRRIQHQGPTPDTSTRMAKIIADHEASCAALRRAEADTE